jgi:hypothetical protein
MAIDRIILYEGVPHLFRLHVLPQDPKHSFDAIGFIGFISAPSSEPFSKSGSRCEMALNTLVGSLPSMITVLVFADWQ